MKGRFWDAIRPQENPNTLYYYINHYSRDLNTNKDTLKESIKYSGTERKKAIEDFNNYIALHPGIITIKDIEKSRWER